MTAGPTISTPCPFCGDLANLYTDAIGKTIAVRCDNCNGRGPDVQVYDHSSAEAWDAAEATAIKLWETRK